MTDKPQTRFTDAANLPSYLQEQGRFCLWRYEKSKDGTRWTKVPYQPKAPQYGAASTNAAHFTDMHTALDNAEGFDGLGLGIFGEVAAVDIDHCIDSTGKLSKLAQTVVETLDSYTEISPSGKGIRIIFRAAGVSYQKGAYYINNQDARDPGEEWESKQGLEIYIAGMTNKYVTVTGRTIRATGVNERSKEVKQILDRYMKKAKAEKSAAPSTPSAVDLNDREIIETASRAKNGGLFDKLYRQGDITGYKSHSEADQALMNILAFYCAGDAERMVQIFKTSALYRPEKKREDYYRRTAETAIEGSSKYYDPKRETPAQPQAAHREKQEEEPALAPSTAQSVDAFLTRVKSEDFRPIPTGYKTIDNAIGGGFIRQTLVFLGAAPGAGKTLFSQQIVERMAKEKRATVLYYNLEMSVEQLLARSLSRATEFSPLQILQGYRWTPQQEPVIRDAASRYKEEVAPRIKYNPCASADYMQILDSMRREAEALEEVGNTLPLVVVIDYLQLLQGAEKDAAETIKAAVKGFKDFAIKYGAVVFCIMAHSRATNTSGVITQGAGRDTSAIEYSGDLQLSLNYADTKTGEVMDSSALEKMYAELAQLLESGRKEEAAKLQSGRKLTVTKNRFGQERSTATLYFFGEYSLFTERETRREDPKSAGTWGDFQREDKKPPVKRI